MRQTWYSHNELIQELDKVRKTAYSNGFIVGLLTGIFLMIVFIVIFAKLVLL